MLQHMERTALILCFLITLHCLCSLSVSAMTIATKTDEKLDKAQQTQLFELLDSEVRNRRSVQAESFTSESLHNYQEINNTLSSKNEVDKGDTVKHIPQEVGTDCPQCTNPSVTSGSQQLSSAGRAEVMTLQEVILHTIHTCEWDSLVLVTDEIHHAIVDVVMDAVSQHTVLSLIHFSISNTTSHEDLVDMFQQTYGVNRKANFLLFTQRIEDMFYAAEAFWAKEKGGSLFVNRAKFLIFACEETCDLQIHVNSSVFDHVAVVFVDNESMGVEYIYTLMWRENRMREFSSAKNSLLDRNCGVFPNIKFGLNGRKLTALTKPFKSYIIKRSQSGSDLLEYDGFSVEIIKILAEHNNFSIVYTPDANSDEEEFSFDEHTRRVKNGEVDFAILTWSITSRYSLNQSVTFPVEYLTVTGAYRYRTTDSESSNLLVQSNSLLLVAVIVGAFLYAVFFLSVMLVVLNNQTLTSNNLLSNGGTETSRNQRYVSHGKYVQSTKRNGSFRNGQHEAFSHGDVISTNTQETVFVHAGLVRRKGPESGSSRRSYNNTTSQEPAFSSSSKSKLSQFCEYSGDVWFKLFGAVVKQGTLPKPQSPTLWPVLWSWCLMSFLMTSFYAGLLVADSVQPKPPEPVSTFEEMLSQGNEFRWCVPRAAQSLIAAMQMADNDSVLGRLYKGLDYLNSDDPHECDDLEGTLERLKVEHNFVAIDIRSELERLRHNYEELSDMIVMKESILDMAAGFPMPLNADLEEMFSHSIHFLHTSGIAEKLFKKWMHSGDDETTIVTSQSSGSFSSFRWFFLIIVALIVTSVIVLAVEIFVHKFCKLKSIWKQIFPCLN